MSSPTSTSNETVVMLGMATGNVKRYFARVLDNTNIFQPEWDSELPRNAVALVLGYLAVITTIALVNNIIESILLNNFAAFSRDWCFAGQNQNRTRLARVQDVLSKGLFGVVLLMRWPGWIWYQLHLWQCVFYGVVGFAASEAALVSCLLVVHGFIWTAHQTAVATDWAPHSVPRSKVHFKEDTLTTPPQREKRFTAPGSVDMGCFLSRHRDEAGKPELSTAATERQKFWTEVSKQGLFVANELNNGVQQTTVYHTIAAKEENWDFSVEELRLQHYKDMGLHTDPPAPPEIVTQNKEQEEKEKGEVVEKQSGSKYLPSWMSGRSFRDSIFGSSVGTETSADTFGKSAANLGPDSRIDVVREGPAAPDLLTGSPLTRRFT